MNRPSDDQLETALDAARRMQQFGVDPHHLARSLIYLSQHNASLWELVAQIDRYIRFGLPESELNRLENQIQELREESEYLESASELQVSAAR